MATTEVRERGILFSDRLVRAILDGRKTQTRRVVKPQPCEPHEMVDEGSIWYETDVVGRWEKRRCPYGVLGDRLYVRECHVIQSSQEVEHDPPFDDGRPLQWIDDPYWGRYWQQCHYRATDPEPELAYPDTSDPACRWRPSIHMPKWASRIMLEITAIRVERVQEITDEDAQAEGAWSPLRYVGAHRDEFSRLWDEINGPRGYWWGDNPWVWVIEFRRVEP